MTDQTETTIEDGAAKRLDATLTKVSSEYIETAEVYLRRRSEPGTDDTVRDAHRGNTMAGVYAGALAAAVRWVAEVDGDYQADQFAEYLDDVLTNGE